MKYISLLFASLLVYTQPLLAQENYKVAVKPVWDTVGAFGDGLAPVSLNAKFRYIDKSGKIQIDTFYGDAKTFSDGHAIVMDYDSGKYGVIDKTGKTVVDFKFEQMGETKNGVVTVSDDGKLWGVVNFKGKEIIPKKWSKIHLDDGSIRVTDYEFYGAFDLQGKEILKLEYDYLDFVKKNLWLALKDRRKTFINSTGKQVLPGKYGVMTQVNNNYITISDSKTGKIGIMDNTGKVLVPFKYDRLEVTDNLVTYREDDKWGLADFKGNVIVKPTYYSSIRFKDGYAIVEKDDKQGVINTKGEIMIPIVHDWLYDNSEGMVSFSEGDFQGFYKIGK